LPTARRARNHLFGRRPGAAPPGKKRSALEGPSHHKVRSRTQLEIARGLAYVATQSQTKYIGSAVEGLATPVAGLAVSPAFLIAVLVVVAGQVVLSRTVFGRYVVAIGTNEPAVRLAGIDTAPVKVAVFALLGVLTGLASVFHTSRLGSSDPNAGVGLELSAIAAVVIGGTSLLGGRGSVVNSFFGVLIIATLEAGLAQVGASEPAKRVITGVVIVGAVILDAWRHRVAGTRWTRLIRLLPLGVHRPDDAGPAAGSQHGR
jgi:ribose transport system permease protein